MRERFNIKTDTLCKCIRRKFKNYGADIIENRVRNKWLPKLEEEQRQMTIYDITEGE